MKLYFAPAACSMAAHIALNEAGLDYELERVDLKAHQTASGEDYYAINPKGSVPALAYNGGSVLTEAAVVLQYIADRKPEAWLAPAAGSIERYRLMEWLNFVSSELHKGFGPFWNPKASADAREQAKEKLAQRFAFVAKALGDKAYLMGDVFTVADAYLYTVLAWTKIHGIDLSPWPPLQAYLARVRERPAVKRTLEEEGIA